MLFVYTDDGANPCPLIFRRMLDGRSLDQPWFKAALFTTTLVVFCSMALSFLVGVLVALLRLSRRTPFRILGGFYVETFRGLPIYVILLFVYFAIRGLLRGIPLPFSLNGFTTSVTPYTVSLSPLVSAVLALGCCYGAYMGEIIRAGILSIPVEEIEAASLEAGRYRVYRHIVLPQALRTILPAMANECIALLKDSSLVGAVTLVDITRAADIHARTTFLFFETFTALGLVYLILSLLLSRVQRSLERNYGTVHAR